MANDRNTSFQQAKRVIVKVGSGILTRSDGLNTQAIRSISRQICRLIARGKEVLLVTSGAMASGVKKVSLPKRPDELPKRQAAAAVGQAGLIMEYEKAFDRFGKKVAQILLTSEDLSNRKRYLNARNTLYTLLSWQVVPIINENDTVSIAEIQFGDNDNLAAMIALLMDADMLINLTVTDGLYDSDPRTSDTATLIPVVSTIGKDIEKLASDIPGALNFGGMLSKIKAAKKITAAGIPMVIANGNTPDILEKLFAGKDFGTYFIPKTEKLASRKCWIGFTLKPKGLIRIDAGAVAAVLARGKSLLPSGITGVEGDFDVGAAVELAGNDQDVIGVGLVNYNAVDIRKIMGCKSGQIRDRLGYKPYDEIIHRDNLVITAVCE
ncbi:MAG: glutamate 5-kinase [Thermodesulfobacteriota bacterium]